jgi:hypothetical protein
MENNNNLNLNMDPSSDHEDNIENDVPNLVSDPIDEQYSEISNILQYLIPNGNTVSMQQYPINIQPNGYSFITNIPYNTQNVGIVPVANLDPVQVVAPSIEDSVAPVPSLEMPDLVDDFGNIVEEELNDDGVVPIVDQYEIPIVNQEPNADAVVPDGAVPIVEANADVVVESEIGEVIIRLSQVIFPIDSLRISQRGIINSNQYHIERFRDKYISITRIDYDYFNDENQLIKKVFWVPTYVALDYKHIQRKLYDDKNLHTIFENKEIASTISYYILTGVMSPEVTDRYDEFHGIKKNPMSKENLNELESFDIDPSKYSDDDACTICCVLFKEDTESKKLIKLSCGDTFCEDCINNWFKTYSNKCPNCNKEFKCENDASSKDDAPNTLENLEPDLSGGDDIDINYLIAYFIVKFASFYRDRSHEFSRKIFNITDLYISQQGMMVMKDCISIFS